MKKEFEDKEFHGDVNIKQGINIDKAINGVGRYVASITQTGTSAPVATVYENTLGVTPILARSDTGNYSIDILSANFWYQPQTMYNSSDRDVLLQKSGTKIQISQYAHPLGAPVDGIAEGMMIEVSLYP